MLRLDDVVPTDEQLPPGTASAGAEGGVLAAAVLRLATLPPLAYDQVREAEAKTLRVRVATLDAAVVRARARLRARVRGPAETHPPGVPEGFALRQGGVFALGGGDGPDLHVCGPLEVVAVTHDGTGRAHGRLLRWQDGDGRLHEWCMPMTLLAGDGTELRARLLDEGLFVGTGARAREALGRYLGTAAPEKIVRIAARCGWHDADGARVFALPDRCIGPPGAPEMRLQTDRPDALPPAVSRGTLPEWKADVAAPCAGNSRLVLSISTAFAPPLLEIVGAEGGGVHIKGASSIGKSTAGAVAGSVWGGGGRRGWAQSWRATDNGLEAVAAAHSDLLLVLDEMGEVSGEALGAAAYMLANGRGKARAGRDGGRRRSTEWRLVFLSTGEVGLADKLAEDGRRPRRAMAGQEVRVVDLPADAGRGLGLFDRLPPGITSARAFADRLRAAAAARYGTAGPAFLELLVAEPDSAAAAVLGAQREFVAAHADGAAGQVARVAARFGLIAAAGELAAGWGIVPWAPGEAARAAARCFADWVATRPGGAGPGEDAAALRQVRAFIEAHGASRFEALAGQEGAPEEARPVPNRAGFRRRGEGGAWEYLILSEAWRTEVCRGLDPIAAAKAVDAAGFLRRGGDGRLQDKPSIPGHGSPRVYVVRGAILGGDAVEAPRSAGAPA